MDASNLGSKMRDRVSGFEGIAVARVEYLNGCVQFCLQGPVKDGKRPDGEYIDQQQLEVIDEQAVSVEAKRTGGPSRDQPSAQYRG